MKCVLDAGVLVALFVPQPTTDDSIAFMSDVLAQSDSELLAPDCIFYEVTAALRKFQRLSGYEDMDADLLRLYELPVTAVSCRDLMHTAAAISREHVLSPYDAFYLALAQREGLPLITADERLVNGVKGKGFDVRSVAQV